LLLINLEIVIGYCTIYKYSIFGQAGIKGIFTLQSTKSTAIVVIIVMATLLCLLTELKGIIVVVLAWLSIVSQMMHSKTFEIQKKHQKNYAIKSTIRDAKTILMFYR